MSKKIRPRRSVLYMPGSNTRAIAKAKSLGADSLILDLEDAVSPEEKEFAREQVCNAIREGGFGYRETIIRINGLLTPWGMEDLLAAVSAKPDAILIPKVSHSSDLTGVRNLIFDAHPDAKVALWAMMETPLAMLNAAEIAAAAGDVDLPLTCLVMGTNDLAKETGASLSQGRTGMLSWLSTCIAAARANRLAVIDGVYNDFRDPEGFEEEAKQGLILGMDGKTLIHPSQIQQANDLFSPDPEEVDWARRIVEAFDLPQNQNKGVINLEGRMVELLHAKIARRTITIADIIAKRS